MLQKILNRRIHKTSSLLSSMLLSFSLSVAASNDSDLSLQGIWAYRSFKNDQNLATDFNKLLFGKGYLILSIDNAVVPGCIGDKGWQLEIFGQEDLRPDGKHTFTLTDDGIVDQEPWKHNYSAQLEPSMHGAQNQALVITGSVLRVLSHSKGKSPAGEVASFAAVKVTDPDLIPQDFLCGL